MLSGFKNHKQAKGTEDNPELDLTSFAKKDFSYLAASDLEGPQGEFKSYAQYVNTVNLLGACMKGNKEEFTRLMDELGYHSGTKIAMHFGGVPHNPYAAVEKQPLNFEGALTLAEIARRIACELITDQLERDYPAPSKKPSI